MTPLPREQLEHIGSAAEIGLASRRPDGSLRPYVTMWVVRAGDGLYVRSAYGPDNPRYRRADRRSVTCPGSHAVTVHLVPQTGGEWA
jgi:hypothetical protein